MNNKNDIKISSNRSFGIVFFIVFLIISFYPLINNNDYRLWSLIISLIFLILGLLNSKFLTPLNKIWFQFGLFLGKIISPIVMGVIFFLVVTPIGILMKFLKKDLLNLKINNSKSYWIEKTDPKSKRILGIFKNKKKILAFANYYCSCSIWWFNNFKPRFCCSTIYLYNFLKCHRF